jgi:AsmA protein
VRKDGLTLLDVKFLADAKQGIVELKPLSTRLLGAQGQGSIRADFTGAVASYRIAYTLTQFPIEEFFSTMSLKKLASGRMDFSAALTTHGTSLKELKQAAAGQVTLRGKSLTFIGIDLDEAFERFESSQNFSLADVGAVFFAGPIGLLVTKGYDFANLSRGTGGSSEIVMLVSDWKVEHGVAQAQDVAMATKAAGPERQAAGAGGAAETAPQAQVTTEAAVAAECEVETVQARPHRISWARLLKRVFSCDMT